jgi:hypothetical protein
MAETLVVGFYKDEHALVTACKAARDAGHPLVEAISPYPVHGIDPVLGIQRSWIGRPVLLTALLGFVAAYGFLHHSSVIEWPILVSGKPYHYWIGFVVPTLELGLLAAALVNLGLVFHATRSLPLPETKVVCPRLTDDAFAVVIPVREGYTAASLCGWLAERGAERTQVILPEAPAVPAPAAEAHP